MGMKSIIGKSMLGVSLAVLLFTGYNMYQEKQMADDLRNKLEVEDTIVQAEEPEAEDDAMLAKFEQLYADNNDLAGWIRIDGTVVDYPVLQFVDNTFYLERDFYGESSRAGSIFMDYRNIPDGNDFNTILYGHHMADGSMFKALMKYKDESFFQEHGIIDFDVLNKEYEWVIFSVYVTDVSFYYIDTSFHSDDKKQEFIEEIRERSMYESDVSVGPEDHILTLSTCTYEFENARFVVHAKRVEK